MEMTNMDLLVFKGAISFLETSYLDNTWVVDSLDKVYEILEVSFKGYSKIYSYIEAMGNSESKNTLKEFKLEKENSDFFILIYVGIKLENGVIMTKHNLTKV